MHVLSRQSLRPFAHDFEADDVPGADWPLVPAVAALVAGWLVIAWPWLSGTYTIPWDGKAHFAPQVQFLAASLGRGEWPGWTPNVFSGQPQIADPQALIFSPPMMLLALSDPSPSLWAIDATVLATMLAGGIGILVYARERRWHWAGALIAALVFMFGGSMAWRLQHFGQVMSLAYLPWALVALEIAIARGRVLAGIAAGLVGAAILLGRDQVGLLAIYLLATFVVWRLFAEAGWWQRLQRAALPLGLGTLAGLVAVAIPLVLTVLLAEQSNRPTIDLAGAGAGSLHPALLITAVVPNLFGAAGEMADYWGPPSFVWENTGLFIAQNMGVMYLGALPLMALVIAVWRGTALEREVVFFTAAALVMLVYALGWYTPAFEWAWRLLPGIDKFRRPADATFLIGGLLAFPIGWSVHRLVQHVEETGALARGWWSAPAACAAGLALALAIAALWDRLGQAIPPIVISAIAIAVAAAAAALARHVLPIRPLAAGAILAIATTVDLAVQNGPNGANALPTEAIDMLEPERPHPTIAALKRLVQERTDDTHRPRIEIVGLGYHWPNASLTHGLENTLGTNPVRLAWYAGATGAGDTVANFDQRAFSAAMPGYDAPLARLLGLSFVATSKELPTDQGPGRGLTLRERIGDHVIYEVAVPLPRAVFATSAAFRPAAAGSHGAAPPDIDYTRTVLLDGVQPGTAEPPSSRRPGTVRIELYKNTEVTLSATSPDGGWLVLNDVWHPWWTVTVNGRERPLLRANGIFRAVEVPPGDAEVRFSFRPLLGAYRQMTSKWTASTPPGAERSGPVVR